MQSSLNIRLPHLVAWKHRNIVDNALLPSPGLLHHVGFVDARNHGQAGEEAVPFSKNGRLGSWGLQGQMQSIWPYLALVWKLTGSGGVPFLVFIVLQISKSEKPQVEI